VRAKVRKQDFEGNSATEGFELSDVVALLDHGVEVSREVVGAEVVEASPGVGEQSR
jgi:arginase family enzyme